MAKQTRLTKLGEKNWRYLVQVKEKNSLKSIDEAVESLRKIAETQLTSKKRKAKIFSEITL